MNGEQNSAKNPGRHISMELTADSARVTSLSLSGSKLVVTIEAELADSQVHAAEDAGGRPPVDSGAVLSEQARYSRSAQPAPGETQQIHGLDVVASPIDETETDTLNVDSLPPLPSPEPVQELTDTWDTPVPGAQPVRSGFVQNPWSAAPAFAPAPTPEPAPAPSAPERDEQDHLETRGDDAVYESETACQHSEPAAQPPVASVTTPAPIQPEPVRPEMSVPAAMSDLVGEPLAITESSSAIGGERHGEPQPTLSFGLDSFGKIVPPPLPVSRPEVGYVSEPAVPDPAPAPAPTPLPEPDVSRGETGGTTVLIRYTCPKCKTQGMQAVDKVGTVVNCSNCGKAMRLVMKK